MEIKFWTVSSGVCLGMYSMTVLASNIFMFWRKSVVLKFHLGYLQATRAKRSRLASYTFRFWVSFVPIAKEARLIIQSHARRFRARKFFAQYQILLRSGAFATLDNLSIIQVKRRIVRCIHCLDPNDWFEDLQDASQSPASFM